MLVYFLVQLRRPQSLGTCINLGPTPSTDEHILAVLIPYRDREAHLRGLLEPLRAHLGAQNIAYDIFIVEQVCHGWGRLMCSATLA